MGNAGSRSARCVARPLPGLLSPEAMHGRLRAPHRHCGQQRSLLGSQRDPALSGPVHDCAPTMQERRRRVRPSGSQTVEEDIRSAGHPSSHRLPCDSGTQRTLVHATELPCATQCHALHVEVPSQGHGLASLVCSLVTSLGRRRRAGCACVLGSRAPSRHRGAAAHQGRHQV